MSLDIRARPEPDLHTSAEAFHALVKPGEAEFNMDTARRLVDFGARLFRAQPCGPTCGQADHDWINKPYHLPARWEQAECSPAPLDAWQPGDGIGLIGGDVLSALDIDRQNDGFATQEAMRRDGLWPTLNYGETASPSGGGHWLTPPLRCIKGSAASVGLPGMDIITAREPGRGAQFMWIPLTVGRSKHPDNLGEWKSYRWEVAPDLDLLATEPEEALQRLVELRNAGRRPTVDLKPTDRIQITIPIPTTRIASRFVAPASPLADPGPAALPEVARRVQGLADELSRAPEGSANHEAARVAFQTGQYIGAGQIEEWEAERILSSAFTGWSWRHPSDERAMLGTIRRQLAAGAASPRAWAAAIAGPTTAPGAPSSNAPAGLGTSAGVPPVAAPGNQLAGLGIVGEVVGIDPEEARRQAIRDSPAYRAMRASMFSEEEFDRRPPPEWVIDGVLPQAAFGYIIGEPGNGKTFVALDLAYCLATGRDWWGHPVKVTGPVVYIAAEDNLGVQMRARAWRSRFLGGELAGQVHFITHPPQVGDPESFEALAMLIEEVRPVLVVIDTQARVTRGMDENDKRSVDPLIHAAEGMQRLGAAVLMVHHPARGGTVPRGSSAQEGAADVVMLCTMDDDKLITVKCTKQKNAAEFEPLSLALEAEGPSAVLMSKTPLRWEGQEQIVAWLDELALPHAVGVPTAIKALEAAGHEVPRRQVEAAVKLRKSRPPVPRLTS